MSTASPAAPAAAVAAGASQLSAASATESAPSSGAASSTASASSGDVYRHKARVYTKTGDGGSSSLFNAERRAKTDDLFQALGDIDELNAHVGVARAHASRARAEAAEAGGQAQPAASAAAPPEGQAEAEAEAESESDDGALARAAADAAAGSSSRTAALLNAQLVEIQSRLFDLGALVATPRAGSNAAQLRRTHFDEAHVGTLERWIDAMEASLPPLRHFILPGGGAGLAAQLHVCRAVCRRAERRVVAVVSRDDADPVAQRFLNRLSDYLFVAARFAAMSEGEPETQWKKPRAPRAAAAASPSSEAE